MTKLQISAIDVELAGATQTQYDAAFMLIVHATEREFVEATRASIRASKWGL